jgi:hypothetical protein
MNPIASQQNLLAEALQTDGWSIVDRATNLAYWEYYEVWTLESQWRPVGLRALVLFLVDPHPPLEDPQRKRIWAVECTSGSPWDAAGRCEPIAKVSITHWERGVAELVESLAGFRNRST